MPVPMTDRELNSRTLYITLTTDSDNVLAAFPFIEAYDGESQHIDDIYQDDNGNTIVCINLGYRADTTFAQEQFLDTNRDVIRYRVSSNIQ